MKVINKPIDMISWTDEQGLIHPMKFRIRCVDEQDHTFDILKVTSSDKERLAGNIMINFVCDINIDGKIKKGLIKFERDTLHWRLFKI